MATHWARNPPRRARSQPDPAQESGPLRTGVDVIDLGVVSAGLRDLRIADALPTGRPERDGLPFQILDAGRRLSLLEGKVEDVVGAHLEDGDEGTALLDHQE